VRGDRQPALGEASIARCRRLCCILLIATALTTHAAYAEGPLALLDVPFIAQSEALCGGAAAAMVLRYWGERGLTAETFSPLVDRSASGITTTALAGEIQRRGFSVTVVQRSTESLRSELALRHPVIALIEDRPGAFHYIVILAWHERGIVFHDPARAPFRVMSVGEFQRRWSASGRWMLVATPDASDTRLAVSEPPPSDRGDVAVGVPTLSTCDRLVADAVHEAQASRLESAERLLSSAIGCPGNAALRELAGLRLIQRRWAEVETLASAAVAQEPTDIYSWKLLGTARFVADDALGALEAWNRADEPKLDLIRIDGLTRTRQRPVERLVGLQAGPVLSASAMLRAQRQLAELPAATAAHLTYVPTGNGLASLRVSIVERPALPRHRVEVAALALTAVAAREVAVGVSSPTGGGERIVAGWRFWPRRPRYSLSLRAPAPWGGVWGVGGAQEEQPFDTASLPTGRHASAEVAVSKWMTSATRWEAAAGLDRWAGRGAFAALRGAFQLTSPSGLITTRVDASTWLAHSRFASWQLTTTVRTSREPRGTVLRAQGAATAVSGAAPADQWVAADTGHVRPILLRAHPLLDEGRLRAARLGRLLVAGSVEAQHWWRPSVVQIAPALFADVARTSLRVSGAPLTDADVGAGLRLRVVGLSGTVRIDFGKGLRDGATAWSLVYEP
jgi:hypothetical protein